MNKKKSPAIFKSPISQNFLDTIQKKSFLNNSPIQFVLSDDKLINHIFKGQRYNASDQPIDGIAGLHAYSDIKQGVNPVNIQGAERMRKGGLPQGIIAKGYIGKLTQVHILHWKRGNDEKFSTMMPINMKESDSKKILLTAHHNVNARTPNINGHNFNLRPAGDTIYPTSSSKMPVTLRELGYTEHNLPPERKPDRDNTAAQILGKRARMSEIYNSLSEADNPQPIIDVLVTKGIYKII